MRNESTQTSGGPGSTPGRKRRPFDPIGFVLRRGLVILLLGGGIFLALIPLAWVLSKPHFQSSGSLIISPEVEQFLSREMNPVPGDLRDFAQTQARRILTDDVLIAALEAIPRADWPQFISPEADTQTAARVLKGRMTVEPVVRSHLIFVGMNAGAPQGLSETINGAMSAFLRKLESEQELQSRRRVSYLQEEKEKILAGIERKKEQAAVIAKQLKNANFSEFKNSYYDLLVDVQSEYVHAKADTLKNRSLLEKAERERQLLKEQELDVFAKDSVASNQAVYLIDNWTYQKLQELRASIDGLTEGNADRVYIEERMEAMTDYLSTYKSDLFDNSLSILNEKRGFELDSEIIKAKNSLDTATNLSAAFELELEEVNELFERTSNLIAQGKEIDADLEDFSNRLTLLENRLAEVTLEAKAPIHIAIEERAIPPTGPAGDSKGKILAMFFVLTFGSIGSVFLGHDFLDGRIRSPREVEAALGWPAPDPIPEFASPSGRATFEDCVRVLPDHECARALRKLVVRLNQERQKSASRTFLFSGSEKQVGASSIVHNVATAFTQYVDRVLVISFDGMLAELPDSHSGHKGAGDGHWAEEILEATSEINSRFFHLSLNSEMPITRDRNALLHLLGLCREGYDAVIIDAPPVLSHDITQFLSLNVDAAIIIARSGTTPYAALRGSIEHVLRGQIPALTAVLNGALPQPIETISRRKDELLKRLVSFTGEIKFPRFMGGEITSRPAPSPEDPTSATQS